MIVNVILDLDETLIYSVDKYNLKLDKNMKSEYSILSKKFKVYSMSSDYFVCERPYLQDFLDFLFDNFNVSIWTAASKEYAIFIINKIILKNPKRKLDYVQFSSHCDQSEKQTGCLKHLDKFFHIPYYNAKNTIIIDDNENVFEKQSNQVIHIKPFSLFNFDADKDTTLQIIQSKLEKMI